MRKVLKILRTLAVCLICLICLCPFAILIILSLSTPQKNMYDGNVLIPDFYFGNFIEGWQKSNIGRAMVNSAVITGEALLLIVVLGALAGYAIARAPSKLNKTIYAIMLSCMMIPGIINTVPLYSLMIKLKAINTLWGMALVCTTLALPQAVFIFTNFVKALPRELEEAAVIDGCTNLQAFWRIVFPLLRPSISSVVILNGFGIWNNYSQSVFFLQRSSKHNVPQALSVYFQQFAGAQWNLMAATALIAIVPVVIVFLIFQKSLMKGLTDGAIKG